MSKIDVRRVGDEIRVQVDFDGCNGLFPESDHQLLESTLDNLCDLKAENRENCEKKLNLTQKVYRRQI